MRSSRCISRTTSAIRKGAFHFPSIARPTTLRAFSKPAETRSTPRVSAGWTIAHMHIVFAQDYSDLLRNCRLFLKTETLGALKRGSWGAAAYEGFEPLDGEIFVTGNANSAFRRTDLEAQLRERGVERVNIMGLATQFSVEHTVRDAADMGYRVRIFADCCASGDIEAHHASLRTLTLLADVVSSDSVFEKTSARAG